MTMWAVDVRPDRVELWADGGVWLTTTTPPNPKDVRLSHAKTKLYRIEGSSAVFTSRGRAGAENDISKAWAGRSFDEIVHGGLFSKECERLLRLWTPWTWELVIVGWSDITDAPAAFVAKADGRACKAYDISSGITVCGPHDPGISIPDHFQRLHESGANAVAFHVDRITVTRDGVAPIERVMQWDETVRLAGQSSDRSVAVEVIDGEVQPDLSSRRTLFDIAGPLSENVLVKHPIGYRLGDTWTISARQPDHEVFDVNFEEGKFSVPVSPVSEFPGSISTWTFRVTSVSPLKSMQIGFGAGVDEPALIYRDSITTAASNGNACDLTGLDFEAGDLIVIAATALSTGTGGGNGVSNATLPTGYEDIESDAASIGNRTLRVRAAKKVADGTEASVQFFTFPGTGDSRARVYHVFAYRFTGAPQQTMDGAEAEGRYGSGTNGPHVAEASANSTPSFVVSLAVLENASAAPDHSFSETPDRNLNSASLSSLKTRVKVKEYGAEDEPDDVTVSYAPAQSDRLSALLTFGIYLNH